MRKEPIMIYFKLLCSLAILLTSLNSMAHTKQPEKETIPFIVYNTETAVCSVQKNKTVESASVVNISTDEIKAIIEPLRRSVCSAVGDADVKVWLSGDVGAKLVVSASLQSGVEVTFHCKSHPQ